MSHFLRIRRKFIRDCPWREPRNLFFFLINLKKIKLYAEIQILNFLIFSCLLLQRRWKLRSNTNDKSHFEIYWRGILETAGYL